MMPQQNIIHSNNHNHNNKSSQEKDDDDDDETNVVMACIQQERKRLRKNESGDSSLSSSSSSSSDVEETKAVAELLLFLAGCYLDACDPTTARRLLITCIALLEELDVLGGYYERKEEAYLLIIKDANKVFQQLSDLYTRAIRECICSFEEDSNWCNDSVRQQRMSRQLLNYVLTNNQKQQIFPSLQVPWFDARQNPGFFYPFLQNQPAIYKAQEFEWCCVLEHHWQEIRTELEELLRTTTSPSSASIPNKNDTSATPSSCHPTHWPSVGDGSHRDGAGEHDGTVVNAAGSWKEWVLFGSGANHHNKTAPRTRQLLQQYCPSAISLAHAGGGEVIFSVLAPHTRIAPHCGTTNLRLTGHLGLIVPPPSSTTTTTTTSLPKNNDKHDTQKQQQKQPPKCAIQIADEWLTWQEGKMLVFDDSFEHQVVNDTDSIRAVLLIRFWHPALPVHERQDALEQALRAKQNDALQRCNPPLPPCRNDDDSTNKAVLKRGMEETHCSSCWGTGFQTIRVDETLRSFYCCCGEGIG